MPATMHERLTPVSWTNVSFHGGFWAPRLEANRRVTLPIEHRQCSETGRIDALRQQWTPDSDSPRPHEFWDSDVAKWIEAAAYSLATHPDADLRAKVDETVGLLEAAQQADGYLNTHFTVVRPQERFTNLRDAHELYCAGHLFEAAVAHHAATGDDAMLNVARRYADLLARTFGPGEGQARGYCGHPEIELALVKLYRATGDRAYLDLASSMVDERGREPNYFVVEAQVRGEPTERTRKRLDYWQAHQPVREQADATGHAVRALYLYSAMADLAQETADGSLLDACRRLWRSATQRRMYVTGGVGSAHRDERFTLDYDLPNEEAYAETCATIALVLFAHRMIHADPDNAGEYADVMERALYNGVLSGVSLDGERFFYANYLASVPGTHELQGRHYTGERQAWFGCACCPPNIARLLASLGGYACSAGGDELRMYLYVQGEIRTEVVGEAVVLRVRTDYPWDERVRIEVDAAPSTPFTLALRVPGWCDGSTMRFNGEATDPDLRAGYALLRRTWQAGDVVELELPMPVRRVYADPRVRHDAGRVALQRGPIVYCLEGTDNGPDLNAIELPPDATLTSRHDPALLGGVTVIEAPAQRLQREDALYSSTPPRHEPVQIRAVPYYAWANRQPGEMLVWIRESRA